MSLSVDILSKIQREVNRTRVPAEKWKDEQWMKCAQAFKKYSKKNIYLSNTNDLWKLLFNDDYGFVIVKYHVKQIWTWAGIGSLSEFESWYETLKLTYNLSKKKSMLRNI